MEGRSSGAGRARARPAAGHSALGFAWILLLAGCATHGPRPSDAPVRVATDAPDHFMVAGQSPEAMLEPTPEMACRNPLVDPRTGVRITLVRSNSGYGDYTVPDGKYGVGEKEVLRVECATGRVVGVFKR